MSRRRPVSVFPLLLVCALACLSGLGAVAAPASAATDEIDRKIEQAARSSYNFRAVLDKQVEVTSRDGVVTLTGVVRDQQQKSLAEATVRELPGVVAVENQLELATPAHERADGWIALKIRGLLLLRSEVSATRTKISVHDGVVTLGGVAESAEQRELTESIARAVQGVRAVHNRMRVRNAAAARETTGAAIRSPAGRM